MIAPILFVLAVTLLALAHSLSVPSMQRTHRPTIRPVPTYEVMTCGSTWYNNNTWINEGLIDYFAVVNATEFTIIATEWGVKPSTDACEAGVYLMMSPTGVENVNATYGPQEKYFLDGDSFKFKVGPVDPATEQYDFMFFGSSGAFPCNFDLNLKQIDIKC
jgi:hypothetical protein